MGTVGMGGEAVRTAAVEGSQLLTHKGKSCREGTVGNDLKGVGGWGLGGGLGMLMLGGLRGRAGGLWGGGSCGGEQVGFGGVVAVGCSELLSHQGKGW